MKKATSILSILLTLNLGLECAILYNVTNVPIKEENKNIKLKEEESTSETTIASEINTTPAKEYIPLSLTDIITSYELQYIKLDNIQMYINHDYMISKLKNNQYIISNDTDKMIISKIELADINLSKFDIIYILEDELLYIEDTTVYKYNPDNNIFIRINIESNDEYIIDELIAMAITVNFN